MQSFFAIFRIASRQMIRSRFFRVLVVLLVLWSCAIPALIADREMGDFLRIALLYSTAGVNLFLGCNAIWLGCFAIDADMESAQLHLVVVKPISRLTVYFAKFCAVAWINLLLLVIAFLAIFGMINFRFRHGEIPAETRERIQNEVLVGRRVYLPDQGDYENASRRIADAMLADAKASGENVNLNDEVYFAREAKKKAMAKDAEMRFNIPKEWRFKNLPAGQLTPLVLRYRVFVKGVTDARQRTTKLVWLAGIPRNEVAGGKTAFDFLPLSSAPEQLMGGTFTERLIPADAIAPDGTLILRAVNLDPDKAPLFLQPTDGPKVLIPVCGFARNFLRMTLVSFLLILTLDAIGCAFASFLSLATAVFCSFGYLLLGILSQHWAMQRTYPDLISRFGYYLAKGVLFFVVPLQNFDATDLVSDGELVEFAWIGTIFLFNVLLRAMPLFAIGAIIYRNRELATAVKR